MSHAILRPREHIKTELGKLAAAGVVGCSGGQAMSPALEAECYYCFHGFPLKVEDGNRIHYGSQRKGMIPDQPCGKKEAS